MTVTLNLEPEVEAGLLAQAQAAGMPLDQFLNRKVEQLARTIPTSAIKEAIEHLSEPERRHLSGCLEGMEERAWDAEIGRDFSPGGRALWLLKEAEADIREGRTVPLEDVLAQAATKRSQSHQDRDSRRG